MNYCEKICVYWFCRKQERRYRFHFSGNFNGHGNAINGLVINRTFTYLYTGFFGYHVGTIANLILTNVDIDGGQLATGGLAGYSSGAISQVAVSSGTVNGVTYTGGLVGYTSSTISNSYAACTVTGTTSYTGGLLGYRESGTTTNCYSTSSITASGGTIVGGLIGYSAASSRVLYSYYAGVITSTATNTGGFIGSVGSSQTYTANYWDKTLNPTRNGVGGANPAGVNASTTVLMKQQLTFSGWDFTNTWCINEGVTYPLLQWYAFIWDNGAGAGDPNWSTLTNWLGDVVPTSGGTVTFNGISLNNSTIDSDAGFGGTIVGLYIYSGYSGTITQARSLSITDDFSQEERISAYSLVNVKFKCYDQLFNRHKPLIYNVFNILRLILKYDSRNRSAQYFVSTNPNFLFPAHSCKSSRRDWKPPQKSKMSRCWRRYQ